VQGLLDQRWHGIKRSAHFSPVHRRPRSDGDKLHSDTNTALKVWQALCAKYAGKRQANMTAFDRYVAEKKGQQPCE
jgi:hypothetical protein